MLETDMPIYPQSACFLFLFLGVRSGERVMPSSLLSEPTLSLLLHLQSRAGPSGQPWRRPGEEEGELGHRARGCFFLNVCAGEGGRAAGLRRPWSVLLQSYTRATYPFSHFPGRCPSRLCPRGWGPERKTQGQASWAKIPSLWAVDLGRGRFRLAPFWGNLGTSAHSSALVLTRRPCGRQAVTTPGAQHRKWALPRVGVEGFLFHPELQTVRETRRPQVWSQFFLWDFVILSETRLLYRINQCPHRLGGCTPRVVWGSLWGMARGEGPRGKEGSQETDGLKTQFVVKAQRVQPGCRTGVEPE